jgi:hypothetical protein
MSGSVVTLAPVMPGLVPGIHAFMQRADRQGVDGRDKPGHDAANRNTP